jgi:hypothetical protein
MLTNGQRVISPLSGSNFVVVAAVTVVVAVAVALGLSVGSVPSHRIASGATEPHCKTSLLTLTTTGEVGLGNASYTIVFHNIGPQSCSMRGYPTVMASLESKPSAVARGAGPRPQLVEIARKTIESQAGGVLGTIEQMRHYRLPTVLLPARTGVASTTIDWGEEQPNSGTKCWTAEKFIITPPRDRADMTLKREGFLCTEIFVSPIVPGRTGVLYLK